MAIFNVPSCFRETGQGDTLRIFTSTLYGKTKTNPNPDPNRYRRRCFPDPNAIIQKKELQIKTEEDGNFKAEKYKIKIEVNILNTTIVGEGSSRVLERGEVSNP